MCAQPALGVPAFPPVLPVEAIANWDVGAKEVSLYRDDEGLKFSVKRKDSEDYELRDQPVSLVAYRSLVTYYMRNQQHGLPLPGALAGKFRDVIHISLANGVDTSSFLPAYFTDAPLMFINGQHRPANLQAALFGRIRSRIINGQLEQTVVGARWGVFNPSSGAVENFEVDPECEATQAFLKRDPLAFESYAKRFSPVLACDATDRIQSVALRQVSVFDKNIVLDEQNWAITLVSHNSPSIVRGVQVDPNSGHAMIACEGIEANNRFLKYAHITIRNLVKGGPDLVNSARIDVHTRHPINPYESINGPTWPRHKRLVESLLHPLESACERQVQIRYASSSGAFRAIQPAVAVARIVGKVVVTIPVIAATIPVAAGIPAAAGGVAAIPAAIGLGPAAGLGMVVAVKTVVIKSAAAAVGYRLKIATVATVQKVIDYSANKINELASCDNCLTFCLANMKSGGILIAVLPCSVIKPRQVIEYLRSHPEAVVLREDPIGVD